MRSEIEETKRACAFIEGREVSPHQTGRVYQESLKLLAQRGRGRLVRAPLKGRVYCDNLVSAREARGLLRREAAERLPMALERLRALERGQADIDEDELSRCLFLYQLPLAYFLRTPSAPLSNGFVCGSGVVPCFRCGTESSLLCDYPMGEGKTCDLPLCHGCRTRVAGELDEDEDPRAIDYCPQHALMAREPLGDSGDRVAADTAL